MFECVCVCLCMCVCVCARVRVRVFVDTCVQVSLKGEELGWGRCNKAPF